MTDNEKALIKMSVLFMVKYKQTTVNYCNLEYLIDTIYKKDLCINYTFSEKETKKWL